MSRVNYIRLSQLAGWVQQTVEETLAPYAFWVVADVTSHTYRAQSHHHYFELVEKDAGSNTLVAKFATRAWQEGADQINIFEQTTGQRFTNGINVLVQVSLNYHPAYGLQLILTEIDPNFTLGTLEKQKQATLQRLLDENPDHVQLVDGTYITANQQLTLNRVIQHIAIISSSTSAGFEDFQHTLENNHFGYTIRMDNYFTSVQGENNAKQLVEKLIEIYQSSIDYDAVIIIRGGGAQTDLLLFEQYAIGKAIARFPVPVITGIGHQKNETIADLMAHTAVKTPTKAAELIIAHNRTFEDELLLIEQEIIIRAQQLITAKQNALSQLSNRLIAKTNAYLSGKREYLSQQHQFITSQGKNLVFHHKSALAELNAKTAARVQLWLLDRKHELQTVQYELRRNSSFYLQKKQYALQNNLTLLRVMSPANIIKKGFALIKVDDQLVSNAIQIHEGGNIKVILANHELSALITGKKEHNETEFNL